MGTIGDRVRLRRKAAAFTERSEPVRGKFLANIGDGTGNIHVTGEPNFVYITRPGRSSIRKALNVKVRPEDGMPVVCGYTAQNPGVLQVLEVDWGAQDGAGDLSYLPAHHDSHELGGGDEVWIAKEQLTALAPYPTNPASMQISVQKDFYAYASTLNYWPGGLTIDFFATPTYLPHAYNGVYVTVSIAGATNLLQYTPGVEFPTWPPPAEGVAIAPPPIGSVPIVAVYLSAGPNLLTNDPGLTTDSFETLDPAGPPPTFLYWSENLLGGAVAQDGTDCGDGGAFSCKITEGGAATNVYQDITVVPGDNRQLRFWNWGDGVNEGRYGIWDQTAGAPIVAITATGHSAASWLEVTQEYTVPAGCNIVRISFYCPVAGGSDAWFDGVTDAQVPNSLSWGALRDIRQLSGSMGGTAATIASMVVMDSIAGSTYDDVQDWIDVTQSAGRISGGAITDAYPLINVALGTGFIKSVDAHVDNPLFFDWPAVAGLNPVPGHNWVYVDYNVGVPTVAVTNDWTAINRHTQFTIAELWDTGAAFHILERGQNVYDGGSSRAHRNLEQMFGFQRGGDGLIVTESGAARTVDMSEGCMYRGLNQILQAHIDTDPGGAADTFTAFYRDGVGGWTEVAGEDDISNSQYDDGVPPLGNLGVGRYGVFWVYLDFDNHLYIQYGQGNYKLAQAEAASVPETMPFLSAFALLIARVIVLQGAATFFSVSFPWDEQFAFADVANHGNLDGLDDVADHLYCLLLDGTRPMTGDLDMDGNAVILDTDGDTSITADVDDQIDIRVFGTDQIAITTSGIDQIAGYDVYPNGDELGAHERFFGRQSFTWHFDDIAALPAGFAWAAAPFVTPTTVTFDGSMISVQDNAANRAFMYRVYAAETYQYLVGVMNPNTVGAYFGLRYDDGTDNNFVEFRQTLTATPPSAWTFSVEATLAGVPQAPVVGTAMTIPAPLIMSTQITGALWANWNMWGKLSSCFGIFSYQMAWQGQQVALNFTPTRSGIITNFLGTAWHEYYYDAYHVS